MNANVNKGGFEQGEGDKVGGCESNAMIALIVYRKGCPVLKLALFLGCGCVLIDPASVSTVSAGSVPTELVGQWLAEDINGGGVIDFLQTTLEINDDGTYAGFAGCNSYTGTFGLSGNEIIFSPPGATRKICVPAVMDQEGKFFEVLKHGLSWRVEDTKLFLSGADSRTALRLVAN